MPFDFKPYLPSIYQLCRHYGVQKLFVFGSAIRSDFGSESDIDLLVEMLELPAIQRGKNLIELEVRLQEILNRKVDLITRESLKNPYLIKEIDSKHKLIFDHARKEAVV